MDVQTSMMDTQVQEGKDGQYKLNNKIQQASEISTADSPTFVGEGNAYLILVCYAQQLYVHAMHTSTCHS